MNVTAYLVLRLRSVANGSQGVTMKGRMARAEASRKRRKLARETVTAAGARALDCDVVVTITRVGGRGLDGDNLQRACKEVRDGIADALDVNDNDKRITWRYAQRKGSAYGVAIDIAPRTHECRCGDCGRAL